MKRSLLAITATTVVAALAAAPTTLGASGHAVRHVSIHDFKFHPARLVVSRGTRIVWKNTDSDPHTIKSTRAHWSSRALDTGRTFTQVARRVGTFTYVCTIHPFMHGVVVVKP